MKVDLLSLIIYTMFSCDLVVDVIFNNDFP